MGLKTGLLFAGLGFVSSVSGTAFAHHSYAQFDRCQVMTIDGEIESIEWANPHTVLSVRTDDAGTYRVEWFSLQRLARAKISSRVLQTGDRISVSGSRHRDPELRVMTLLTEVRRLSDGWGWSRPPAETRAASCAG